MTNREKLARELAESLYSKAIHDDDGSEETISGIADAFAECLRAVEIEALDEADRAVFLAETRYIPIGQAIGLSLAREVIANLRGKALLAHGTPYYEASGALAQALAQCEADALERVLVELRPFLKKHSAVTRAHATAQAMIARIEKLKPAGGT